MAAFLSGLEMLFFLIMLAFILAFTVPLQGTLVRFRASYNPRGLALDSEGGAAPFTGPIAKSYFDMMARVYRIEVLRFCLCVADIFLTPCVDRVGRVCTKASVST